METYPIVLGTAGHIDHGKTALVKALTGIDTDRLKEEKERGITTELGFAHLDLGGRRFGLVDVPGHERFIKSMVSGAGGLDLVCLVIAADEGIMPQTQEHLDICHLLGVRRGVVALSKRDLVDDDWIALVSDDIRQGLAGSFLADAAIVPVSAKTGAGLDELRTELLRLTEDLPARTADGTFRMPLDRVFTIKGFGTVVTGTILGGTVREGDQLIAHPRGVVGKVRGIQLYGDASGEARAGMRCALNLSGVSRDQLGRGDMLAHPGAIEPTHILDAQFRYLSTSKQPLGRRSRILLHHATAQLMATLVLADRDQLQPGEDALVQLRLDAETPLAALPGDRFIARGFTVQEHYGTTIGGGEIVRVHAPKVKRSSEDAARTIARLADAEGDERVALEVASANVAARSKEELARRLGLPAAELDQRLQRLTESGELVRAGDLFMHATAFAGLEKAAVDQLDAFHAAEPHRDGMPKEDLRGRLPSSLPPKLYELLLAELGRRSAIEVAGDTVRRQKGARPSEKLDAASQAVLDQFRGWGLQSPKLKEVPREIGKPDKEARAILDRLLSAKQLIRIKSDYYVAADAIDTLRDQLVAHLDQHGQITPAEWKAITGASRKFSIPLAEYFDSEKLTLRIGDIRKRRG